MSLQEFTFIFLYLVYILVLPDDSSDLREEFLHWLKENNMASYFAALEEEGFDAIENLTLLSEDEISELATAIKMKFGHKRRFPVIIKKAREDLQEAEEIGAVKKKSRIQKEKARIEHDTITAAAQIQNELLATGQVQEVTSKLKSSSFAMPPGKDHFAFISHKKVRYSLLCPYF